MNSTYINSILGNLIFVIHKLLVYFIILGFLMPGETIFHSGTLVKRRYFSVKTRFFMLITGNAEPRLIYIDAEKKDLKGQRPTRKSKRLDEGGRGARLGTGAHASCEWRT